MYRGNDIREIIRDTLLPIVGKKCALFNLPYHDNIGDVLIWEGEEAFLKDNGIECVGRFSIYTFDRCELELDVTICIHGGGHLGDTWRGFQNEINAIVKSYPNHRIVVFPQSVHYNNQSYIQLDSEVLGSHKDLYICARDKVSYDFLCRAFSNNIRLVPDMALYLEEVAEEKRYEKKLFLKRTDKEATDLSGFDFHGLEIHDWPTVEYVYSNTKQVPSTNRINRKLLRIGLKALPHRFVFRVFEGRVIKSIESDKIGIGTKWRVCHEELRYLIYLNQYKLNGKLNRLIDWFATAYYRPVTVAYGVDFIRQYDVVYTTRLHGGILCMILGKTCWLIDNSNHKISAFYNTWCDYLGDRVSVI